jgi:hypothetical protein
VHDFSENDFPVDLLHGDLLADGGGAIHASHYTIS